MKKLECLKIVYNYYPRGINCIVQREKYVKTNEHKKLVRHINDHISCNSSEHFAEMLGLTSTKDFNFTNKTYLEWMDRCYTFEFLESIGSTRVLLRLLVSIIVPVYTLKFFYIKPEKDRIKYIDSCISDFDYPSLIMDLKFKLGSVGYEEFDKNLIFDIIEDVNFDDIEMGRFSFFNAFFNSQNF